MRFRLPALMDAYRATGADLPWGRPERWHGVAMEGYFWRITDPVTRRVLIALIGVNQGPRGPWATMAVGTSAGEGTPAGLVETASNPTPAEERGTSVSKPHPTPAEERGTSVSKPSGAWANPHHLAAGCGDDFFGDDRRLHVRVPGCRLDATFDGLLRWPHRTWGGSSVFQMVPGLNQYWHPWLLGGRASGFVELHGDRWSFTDAQVYGEKNWGRGGFPDAWWWGQAQGFDDPRACVAFAGGQVYAGPLRTEVTGLVVRLPDGRVIRLGNPGLSPVHARTADDTWNLRGRSRDWEIDVDAHAPLARAHVLPVPVPAEHRNTPGALEHLTGHLVVTVRHRRRMLWTGTSELAGLEHGGLQRAETELARRGGRPTP